MALWFRGNEVYRVTSRKDQFGESESFICNTCRYDKKEATDWVIEGPREVKQLSVINQNHYKVVVKPAVISPIEGKMEIK